MERRSIRLSRQNIFIAGLSVLLSILLVACGSATTALPVIAHSKSHNASASSDNLSTCRSLISPAYADEITGTTTMNVYAATATFSSPQPTGNCGYYTFETAGGVPNYKNSLLFTVWLHQTSASTTYGAGLLNLNPYNEPTDAPITVSGVGDNAAWSAGDLLVEIGSSVFLFDGQGFSESASIIVAQHIVKEITNSTSTSGFIREYANIRNRRLIPII